MKSYTYKSCKIYYDDSEDEVRITNKDSNLKVIDKEASIVRTIKNLIIVFKLHKGSIAMNLINKSKKIVIEGDPAKGDKEITVLFEDIKNFIKEIEKN